MSESAFIRLEDVVLDESFPDVDLALRRGRHIDADDGAWFTFLCDAQAHLEALYRRFGADLVRRSEGYFYLLPTNERLGRRQLSVAEMLVGQALTLLYLDPSTIQGGGTVTKADVLSHLASVMGTESLVRALNPAKKKKLDERVAEETVRARVGEALRRLGALGFVDFVEEDRMRLRASLMRFAEPVRGGTADAEALERLVAAGEVVFTDEEEDATDPRSAESDETEADDERAEEPFLLSDAELADLDPSDETFERGPDPIADTDTDSSGEPEPDLEPTPGPRPELDPIPDPDPDPVPGPDPDPIPSPEPAIPAPDPLHDPVPEPIVDEGASPAETETETAGDDP
jgi:chromosome partition protein MukE